MDIKHLAMVAAAILPRLAFAQTPDTTAPWQYVPLEIGNVWEYHGYGMEPGDRRVAIEADTLLDGKRYFVEFREYIHYDGTRSENRSFIRFDTTTSNLLLRLDTGEEVIWQESGCPLDSAFGSTVDCTWSRGTLVTGGYDRSFELSDGSVLHDVTFKSFDGIYEYVAGIGYVAYNLLMEPGGRKLAFASVGGVEYGKPLSLSKERPAREGRTWQLEVYPNPVKERAVMRRCCLPPHHLFWSNNLNTAPDHSKRPPYPSEKGSSHRWNGP